MTRLGSLALSRFIDSRWSFKKRESLPAAHRLGWSLRSLQARKAPYPRYTLGFVGLPPHTPQQFVGLPPHTPKVCALRSLGQGLRALPCRPLPSSKSGVRSGQGSAPATLRLSLLFARGKAQPPAGLLICYRLPMPRNCAMWAKQGIVRRPRLGGIRNLPPPAGAVATAFRSPSLFYYSMRSLALRPTGAWRSWAATRGGPRPRSVPGGGGPRPRFSPSPPLKGQSGVPP